MDDPAAWWASQTPTRRRLLTLGAVLVLLAAGLAVAATREPTAPVQVPRPAGTLVDIQPPALSTTTSRAARATTTSVDPPMATSPHTVPLPQAPR